MKYLKFIRIEYNERNHRFHFEKLYQSHKTLLRTNGYHYPWIKITRGMPKGRKYANDRDPTIQEIKNNILFQGSWQLQLEICLQLYSLYLWEH